MTETKGWRLPEGFLFGVCNSPYHSEGGYNTPDGPHNNWSAWEAAGIIERSGETNRFWDDWRPQIETAARAGLNLFRMGFDWARLQPASSPDEGPEPAWDEQAFDRYAEIVGAVYDAGMEPCITLHHFTHPAWLGPHVWIDDANVALFIGYTRRAVGEVNARLVRAGYPPIWMYVTFNEPFNALAGPYLFGDAPPGNVRRDEAAFETATVNMLTAHVHCYDLIHDLYAANGWREPHVAFNIVSYSVYEIDQWYLDVVRARSLGVRREQLPAFLKARRHAFNAAMNPLARQRLDPFQRWYWATVRSRYQTMYHRFDLGALLDAIYASPRARKLDYIGIDCYDPFALAAVSFADVYQRPPAPAGIGGERFDWTRLAFDPASMREHLRHHGVGLGDLPLYVLEITIGHNQPRGGRAEPRPDGMTRDRLLQESLREVVALLRAGTPLQGYLYWTLCDNYEWGTYRSRLGLVEYDYERHQIKETDAFGVPTLALFHDLITALRAGDPEAIEQTLGAADAPAHSASGGQR